MDMFGVMLEVKSQLHHQFIVTYITGNFGASLCSHNGNGIGFKVVAFEGHLYNASFVKFL